MVLSKPSLYYGICRLVFFFVAAAASFNGFYQKWHFCEAGVRGQYYRADFASMLDGTAWRPYVYRQMLPSIANWLDRNVSPGLKNQLYIRQGNGHTAISISAIADSPVATNPVYFFRYLVVYLATFLFAFLAVYAMYMVCKALGTSPQVATLAPVLFILMIPYFMSIGGYFYDYSELAFFALVVWILLRFDWWWAIPVTALGTWNKESFLLLVPSLYPIIRRRTSRLSAVLGVLALCAVCVAVYFPERLHYALNPGSTMEFRLLDQIQFILHPRSVFLATEETYGVRMFRAFTVAPLMLLVWTVWRGWGRLPAVIKRHGQIAAIINLPLYFLFCGAGEMRDLSLLYMVFLAILVVNLSDWMSGSQKPMELRFDELDQPLKTALQPTEC